MDSLGVNLTEDVQYCFPHLRGSCPKFHRQAVVKVAMYAFMLATILVTVCGNLLVIISISHFKHLHSPTNFILLSLALTDCLLGCLIMPYSMVRSVEGCWYLGETACEVYSGLDMMLCHASIMHLCLISIDRYWAICEPLRYRSIITTVNVALCIGITWLFSFGFSYGMVLSKVNIVGIEAYIILHSCVGNCVFISNKKWGVIAVLVSFVIPGTMMTFLYLKIFYVARKHAKVISDTKVIATTSDKKPVSEQRERKAAITLGIVMGVFLLCWIPFFVATIIAPFLGFSTPFTIFDALVCFGYFNSTCNPLIYGFFYPSFQRAFEIILKRYVCHHRSSAISMINNSF